MLFRWKDFWQTLQVKSAFGLLNRAGTEDDVAVSVLFPAPGIRDIRFFVMSSFDSSFFSVAAGSTDFVDDVDGPAVGCSFTTFVLIVIRLVGRKAGRFAFGDFFDKGELTLPIRDTPPIVKRVLFSTLGTTDNLTDFRAAIKEGRVVFVGSGEEGKRRNCINLTLQG